MTRVGIEPLGRAHLDALWRFARAPDVFDMLFPDADESRMVVRRSLEGLEAARAARREYVFAVMVEGVGMAGIVRVDRDFERWTEGELGYFIGAAHQGRGYATAGAVMAVDHAFAHEGFELIRAQCLESNPASVRVLQKLRFAPPGAAVSADEVGAELGSHERVVSFVLHRVAFEPRPQAH